MGTARSATRAAHSGGSASRSTPSQLSAAAGDGSSSPSGAGGSPVRTRIVAGVGRGAAHEKGPAPGRHLRPGRAPAGAADPPARAAASCAAGSDG